jgi:hypothetical protein
MQQADKTWGELHCRPSRLLSLWLSHLCLQCRQVSSIRTVSTAGMEHSRMVSTESMPSGLEQTHTTYRHTYGLTSTNTCTSAHKHTHMDEQLSTPMEEVNTIVPTYSRWTSRTPSMWILYSPDKPLNWYHSRSPGVTTTSRFPLQSGRRGCSCS